MKPGCSSACKVHTSQRLFIMLDLGRRTDIFQVKLSLTSDVGIGIKSGLYTDPQAANVHLKCSPAIL